MYLKAITAGVLTFKYTNLQKYPVDTMTKYRFTSMAKESRTMETYHPGSETPKDTSKKRIGYFDGVEYEERPGAPWKYALTNAVTTAALTLCISWGFPGVIAVILITTAWFTITPRLDPMNFSPYNDRGTLPKSSTQSMVFVAIIVGAVIIPSVVVQGSMLITVIASAVVFALTLYYSRQLMPWRYSTGGVTPHVQ